MTDLYELAELDELAELYELAVALDRTIDQYTDHGTDIDSAIEKAVDDVLPDEPLGLIASDVSAELVAAKDFWGYLDTLVIHDTLLEVTS